MQFEFVDRYSATGTPYPDPLTMCTGYCEGMGVYPVKHLDWVSAYENGRITKAEYIHRKEQWHKNHHEGCGFSFKNIFGWILGLRKCDGWHFITCEKCNGTGKRDPREEDYLGEKGNEQMEEKERRA